MSRHAAIRPTHGVFPLLELLESMPGVFQDHLLPALQDRHKAALAATCTQLREQVQHTVTKLNLHAGKCCMVHADEIAPKLPNIAELSLKPGNLHEAMYVLPIFFMQDACHMSGITSLQLLDQLPDRPPDRIQCGSCLAFTSTYDLSAILVTAGRCMPRLAALDFSTHYISDAECAAIALMTGLTRLQLRSTHGTKSGGIARFTSLQKLADLNLLDSNLERFGHAGDLAMLLGRSCLTHLQIRYHPVLVPAMLSALVEMQEATDETTAEAARTSSGSRRASLVTAAGTTATPTSPAESSAIHRNSISAPTAAHNDSNNSPAPPLKSLSIVLSPYMRAAADAVQHAAQLTNLTKLSLGWYARMGHLAAGEAADEVIPQAVQTQLGQLVRLQELAIGWPATYGVLAALTSLPGLTRLHLGRLPAKKPPSGLQLPSVKRLTLHLKHTALFPGDDVPNWVATQHRDMVEGLVAFPSLTALELTGDIPAHTLAHLPAVSSAGLQELLLPQRMMSPTRQDLASLRMLTGLTSLRIGWRAAFHDGPPSLPDWDEDPLDIHIAQVLAVTATASTELQPVNQAAGEAGAAGANSSLGAPKLSKVVSLAALTELRGLQLIRPEAATVAAGEPEVANASSSSAAGLLSAPGEAAEPGAVDVTAAAQLTCSTCSTSAREGCLCRLQRLELVGPVTGSEFKHLSGLPSLHTVVFRDNASWSSGLPCDDLAELVVQCSSLRRLEVAGSPGVEGLILEQRIRAMSPQRLDSVDIVVQGGGKSAVELGMGHQFIGDVFSPAQERGDEEIMWWGGAHNDADPAVDPGAVIGPQPNAAPHLQQVQQAVLQLHDLVGQLQQMNGMLAGNHNLLQQLQQPQGQQAQGANDNVQGVAALLQNALQQHNQLMQAMAEQVQQLQVADFMNQQLQALAGQLQQLAAVGGWMQPQLEAMGLQLQEAAQQGAAGLLNPAEGVADQDEDVAMANPAEDMGNAVL